MKARAIRTVICSVGVVAAAEEPQSQNETQNKEHGDYEDEDLCCFPHVAHSPVIFPLQLGKTIL